MRRALAAAEGLDDDALLSSALAVSAMADLLLGRGLDDEKLMRALALEDPDQSIPLERRPSLLAGWAWLHADEFDRARALFESLLASLVERGEESELPELLASLARLECFAGNLVKAREFADRAYELACQAGSESLAATARAICALVHAHAGEVVEARVAAGEAIAAATRSGWQIAAFWASTALGFLEVTLGNDEAAVTTLAHSIALVEQDGVVEPSRRPFLPDAIEALVRLGELERADRLTRLLEDRGWALERRSAVVAAARCRALVLAARGDVAGALEQLDRVLAGGPGPPMPLELARTLIVKGQLERRRKQKRAARRSLQEALAVCERLGAALWAERAGRELDRLGRVPDPDQLTPTEARVAKLSASGLTNRQVAAAAFLSQKTVEANLTRIYRKLGIRSRAELGAWVAGRDSLPD